MRLAARAVGSLLGSFVVAASLISPAPAAEGDVARERLQGLQRWLDSASGLHASFRQTLESGALGAGLEESGELWLQRPGRMRWEYNDPEFKLAIVVGERSWLYIEEDRQLFLGLLDERQSLLPRLLASDTRLATHFEPFIKKGVNVEGGGRDGLALTLVPRGQGVEFRQLELLLAPGSFAVLEARLTDPGGNRMRYSFAGWSDDPEMSEERFSFEPPPGTEIVGSHDR